MPIIIFLSDGEDSFSDTVMFNLGRRALALGYVIVSKRRNIPDQTVRRKPLAFHSVSFGEDSSETSLRRMADIAQQVYVTAPRTAGVGGGTNNKPQCTFSKALDSVRFLRNHTTVAAHHHLYR